MAIEPGGLRGTDYHMETAMLAISPHSFAALGRRMKRKPPFVSWWRKRTLLLIGSG